jgi:H+/Cl- antiporter ClcA
LGVFRFCAQLPITPIWDFTQTYDGAVAAQLDESTPMHVVYGVFLGVIGAATAGIFAKGHWLVMTLFRSRGLIDSDGKHAIPRAMYGAVVVVGLGMLIPHTLFWGEFEIQTIATLAPADTLEHIWPTSGLFGFEMDSFWTCVLVAVAKLVAISFTVAGGYRGG